MKEDEKGRYGLKDGKIRCNQAHSIKVELNLLEINPLKYLNSVKDKGSLKGKRHHIHLTPNKDTTYESGKRYGGNPPLS